MVVSTYQTSLEEFETYIPDPANTDRDFELIGGEIVTVVSNNYSSIVAMLIGGLVSVYVYQNDLGYVTGADGGYEIGEERYMPDVGFISKSRQQSPCEEAYNPKPPDLTIEVISPTDSARQLRLKVANYLAHHVIVWVFDPDNEQVEVYRPNQPPDILSDDDVLDGGDVLPGFKAVVKDLFPARKQNSQ